MAGKITIQDIALLAGVSKTTVSRVLNRKPDVDPQTRERILRIVDEQGFFPSVAATGLAGKRSHLIGALVPALTWPLIPEIMRGVAEVIDQTPYELVLYSINSSNHEKDRRAVINRILGTQLTAGVLAIYPGQSAPYLAELHRQGFPVVLLDDQGIPPEDMPWVGADQCVGAYEATSHLIQQGHRRIAHIQGPLKYQVSLDRYEGYCRALADAGIPLDANLVLQGDFMAAGGKECANRLFELGERRPDAIFVGSDLMALGVIGAAGHYGLRIPEDVAIVGFDDISLSAHMQPALTTVKQPLYEMGQCAINLLLQMVDASREEEFRSDVSLRIPATSGGLAQGNTPLQAHIMLATRLVLRASCGSVHYMSETLP